MITGILSAKFILKAGVILGTGLFNSKLFGAVGKTAGEKLIMSYAGAAVGTYVGIRVVNDMDEMLTNAYNEFKNKEEEKEVVNG